MVMWYKRRTRPWRVERLTVEGDIPWYEQLRSPRVLWQVGTLGVLALATLLIAQLPQPPLPYRKNEPTAHPILARVEFGYVDREVTGQVRELTALQTVPDMYVPDARQATVLRDKLLALVADIAKAESPDKAPEASLTAWKITPTSTATFAAVKKALGDQAANLPAVQETITKAMANIADPMKLAIVREEDYRRANTRIELIQDLRTKLPAGRKPDAGPLASEPVTAEVAIGLPEGDKPLPLRRILTQTQTDSIQACIRQLIDDPLSPIFGEKGVGDISTVLASQVGLTLVYDLAKTENLRKAAIDTVKDQQVDRKANTTLVEAGKEITDADLKILRQEQAAWLASLGWGQRLLAWVGACSLICILLVLLAAYTIRFQPNIARSVPRTVMMGVLALITVALCKIVAQGSGPVQLYTGILILTGMIVAVAYSEVFALLAQVMLTLLVALATHADFPWVMTTLIGSSVAILAVGPINNRSKLIRVGALAGAALFILQSAQAFWGLSYADAASKTVVYVVLLPALYYLAVGLAAGILMLAILPFIERFFGVVTNISLLELCDINQPALKRLALEAPGSYTHSLLIGTLAEAAAEAVGGNGLLARVGAYFHDIGKANKPHYFIENIEEAQNPHKKLSPAMSRIIIMSHVKDGLEMSDRLELPRVIRQFIAEHHGTSLLEFFYREAQRQAMESGSAPPAEADYRYPGPKPRSVETAIVMLADVVEGATRSLADRTAAKIGSTVHEMIMRRLLDGQLDRSGLTLSDIHKIGETLTKVLLSVYHGRVPYPPEPEGNGAATRADGQGQPPPEPRGGGYAGTKSPRN
jgi:cyclic-di-AMP phosphodiesterase PgpH